MLRRIGSTLTIACVWAATTLAGPITPPPGPVSPTGRPLSEIQSAIPINATSAPAEGNTLHKITRSGSYYLTEDLVIPNGKSGILIASSSVTLDLNGHSIMGDSGFAGFAISTGSGSYSQITVMNGRIDSLAGATVRILASRSRLANLSVNGMPGAGGLVLGDGIVENCYVDSTSATGIDVGSGSIRDSRSSSNVGDGFKIGRSTFIERCFASGNTGVGIRATSEAHISQCTLAVNFGGNIVAGEYSIVTDCISAGPGTTGIDAGSHTTVERCVVYSPSDACIKASNACTIRGNYCVSGSSGIVVTSTYNRIEDNTFHGNSTGVHVTGTNNFIARNICSSNQTNWNVVAGNKCLVVEGINAGPIVGDSGGTGPGSTHPLANYTY